MLMCECPNFQCERAEAELNVIISHNGVHTGKKSMAVHKEPRGTAGRACLTIEARDGGGGALSPVTVQHDRLGNESHIDQITLRQKKERKDEEGGGETVTWRSV